MRTAVLRMVIDPDGRLDSERYAAGLAALADAHVEVVASPFLSLPTRRREIEVIVSDDRPVDLYVAACADAFGTECAPGVMTYVSRGTDEDVHGLLAGFHLSGVVERAEADGAEVVTVTVTTSDVRAVPESRLHTALEAALNSEVRLVIREATSTAE